MSYGGFFKDYEEDYYEPYYKPTLADEIFDEAKEKLEKALKKEFEIKIQRADKILAEQEEIRTKLLTKENKLNSRERELESKFKDVENEFAKKKLGEFMAMLQKYLGQTYYEVDNYGELKPKCDACNDKRMLDITLPDGSIKTIECSCSKYIYRYRVIEKMIGIKIEKDGRQQKIWLKYNDYIDEISSINPAYNINEKFEDVKNKDESYKAFYTNKEEAQKHADYLNKLKEEK